MQGGIVVNGTADRAISAPIYGGVIVDGKASVDVISTISGGVKVNGTSDAPFTDVVETNGGVKVNGTSRISKVIDSITIDGCVQVDGSAIHRMYFRPVMSGGVVVDGIAPYNKTMTNLMLVSVLVNGRANILFTYYLGTSGGVIVAGHIHPSMDGEVQGGVKLNGTTPELTLHLAESGGGIIVSGGHRHRFIDYFVFDGGIVVNGSADRFDPVCHYEATGVIIIDGEARIWRRAFYIYGPDGNIIIIGGESLVGPGYEGNGTIIVGGTAPPTRATYRYLPTGRIIIIGGESTYEQRDVSGGVKIGGRAQPPVTDYTYIGDGTIIIGGDGYLRATYRYLPTGRIIIIGGDSDDTYYQVPGPGILLGGSATLDHHVYIGDGTIIIGGDGQPLRATYRYLPTGRIIIIGGEATTTLGIPQHGTVLLSGSADINIAHYRFVGGNDGSIIIGGENRIVYATLHWETSGRIIIIGGDATILPGQYSHEATDGIRVSGVSDTEFTFEAEECPEKLFRCKVVYGNIEYDCPEVLFFYGDVRIYEDDFYDPTSKGILAPIIICRQRFIIPPMDRHPEVPKQRSN
jgi:hypothetical protein